MALIRPLRIFPHTLTHTQRIRSTKNSFEVTKYCAPKTKYALYHNHDTVNEEKIADRFRMVNDFATEKEQQHHSRKNVRHKPESVSSGKCKKKLYGI